MEKELMNKFIGGIVFLFILVLGVYTLQDYYILDKVTVNVTGKDNVCRNAGSSNDCKYIIYSESETFENTDSWLYFKFNSRDFQGKIHDGEMTLGVYGWRVPFFSMSRNIVKIYD